MKKLPFFVILLSGLLVSAADAAVIVNGSFNDLNGVTAPNPTLVHSTGAEMPQGWLNLAISPDWAAPGFNTPAAPMMTTSPDGGNWVMGYSDIFIAEAIGAATTVTDFVIGTTYELSFYQAHNSSNGGLSSPGAWDVTLFGTTLTSPLLADVGDNQVWSLATLQFVATATTSALSFTVGTPDTGISLDGVSISEVGSAAVPEPSTLVLWCMGAVTLVGLGWRRRKQAA